MKYIALILMVVILVGMAIDVMLFFMPPVVWTINVFIVLWFLMKASLLYGLTQSYITRNEDWLTRRIW